MEGWAEYLTREAATVTNPRVHPPGFVPVFRVADYRLPSTRVIVLNSAYNVVSAYILGRKYGGRVTGADGGFLCYFLIRAYMSASVVRPIDALYFPVKVNLYCSHGPPFECEWYPSALVMDAEERGVISYRGYLD